MLKKARQEKHESHFSQDGVHKKDTEIRWQSTILEKKKSFSIASLLKDTTFQLREQNGCRTPKHWILNVDGPQKPLRQRGQLRLQFDSGYIIKKNSSRGPQHGQSERRIMLNKKDMQRIKRTEIIRQFSQDGEQMKNTENRWDLSVSERKKSCFTTKLLWRGTTFQLRNLNEYRIQSIGLSR